MKRSLLLAAATGLLATAPAFAGDKNPVVVIETSMGNVKVELFQDKAPITVKNFLKYVDKGFYSGTIFHRVIPSFMIQGGGFEPGMRLKPTDEPIKNEAGNRLSNTRGTLAMARTDDPDSATSQFYINVRDNKGLDRANSADGMGYTVFGKVLEGMDIVDKIKSVRTGVRGRAENVPIEDVVIKSIRRASN
jgi:cyclophilin family peptidyl-prolyl cis-trans isomerase